MSAPPRRWASFADDVEMLRAKTNKAGGGVTTRSLLGDGARRVGPRQQSGHPAGRIPPLGRPVGPRRRPAGAHLGSPSAPRPDRFPWGWLAARLSDGYESEGGHGVQLATVHKVKGREWPHVIVYEASKGLMPHRLSCDLEEERRVFHVAITRCSESVTLICGNPATDFQNEMTTRYRPPPKPDPDTTTGLLTPPVVVGSASSPQPAAAAKLAQRPKPNPNRPPGSGRVRSVESLAPRAQPADNVPAYIVFSNAHPHRVGHPPPHHRRRAASRPGIGPAKLAAYGEAVKEVLGQFVKL